ncbi:hypothetical protein GQ53DRAFT_877988 [Thozetella sp. PMI_491]|nr:hypothetical protein GQ53DRAFT_877988 [Thozetella sp. PMI_491]
MVRMWTSLSLLGLFGANALAASNVACTRTATAKAGDTCASLGATYSLSVTDFLRANPGITVCTLVAGASYCVAADGSTATAAPPTATAGRPPSSSSPAQPTGSLIPSPDGSDGICGGQYTCLGSVYGDCCSLVGYCGNSTDYCGENCNPLFGRCGGGTAPEAGTGTVTVTVTVGGGAGATSTVTITKLQTQTATVTKTVTATPTATPTPSPVLQGTNNRCNKWYQVKATDRCQAIARTYGITTTQISSWNPNFDCYDVEDFGGYYICVGVASP